MDFQAAMGIPTRMALIDWSLQHLGDRDTHKCPELKIGVIGECSASEALSRKRAAQKYFTPIGRGTVIDRLPQGLAVQVEALIDANNSNGGAVLLLKNLRTGKLDGGRKDVLVIEDGFLTEQQMATVSVLAPDAVFNEIQDEQLTKRRVESVSHITAGSCPNKDCVTAIDVEAQLYPHFHIVEDDGEQRMQCHYCERHFHNGEVFK